MSLLDKSVLVSGIDPKTTDDDLKEAFSEYGSVEKVVRKLDASGRPLLTGAIIVLGNSGQADAAKNATPTITTWVLAAPDIQEQELKTLITDLELQESLSKTYQGLTPAAKLRALQRLMATAPDGAGDLGFAPVKKELTSDSPVDVKPANGSLNVPKENVPDTVRLKVPRLPVFSGDQRTKDSSFARWQYQVKVLQKGPYDEYSILAAIHQSLRSPAADTLLTVGPEATVEQILGKFRTRYGSVLTVDALTEKLYGLRQGQESITSWAFRVEEVVYQIEEKDGITHDDVPLKVKGRFWNGLQDTRIKEATRSTWMEKSLDELLVLCRTLEEEYGSTVKVHQQSVLEDKLDEVLKSMQSMDSRVKKLEQKLEGRTDVLKSPGPKSEDKSEKKVFRCTKCKKEGHLWFGCKKDSDIRCRKCDKPGHLQNCCREPLNRE